MSALGECTRRSFLKGGALALVGLGSVPRFLVRAAGAEAVSGRPRILIAVFQRGAVDGLSMIVPHAEPAYYAARRSIAIARPIPNNTETTIDLEGRFGLHPALASLKPLWDERRLAVVHGERSRAGAVPARREGLPGPRR